MKKNNADHLLCRVPFDFENDADNNHGGLSVFFGVSWGNVFLVGEAIIQTNSNNV